MQLEASSERPADKGPGSSTSELWVPEHNCLSTQFLPDLTADDVQPRNQHLILNSHIGMGQNGNSGTRRKGGDCVLGWESNCPHSVTEWPYISHPVRTFPLENQVVPDFPLE